MIYNAKSIISLLQKAEIKKYLFDKGIKSLSLVGSYSTGKQHSKSDIDLIYEKKDPQNFSLLDRLIIEKYLLKKMKCKIDMISPTYIHPYIKKGLLSTKIKIF